MYNKNIIFHPVGCSFQRTFIETRKKKEPSPKGSTTIERKNVFLCQLKVHWVCFIFIKLKIIYFLD